MYFTSRPRGFRQLKKIFSGRSLACLLATLSASLASYGGTTPSAPAPTEAAANNAPAAKTAKKPERYDIDHIGQRGIGRGFNLYSVKREHELGQSLAASFDRTTRVIHDPVVIDYVNSLAQKIVRYSDADIPFTVRVIDSGDVPRAYGLPGGFLYVDSALILSADGEAELASVMAHEIAHVAARHATRALTRKRVCDVVGSIAMVAGPAGMGVADAGGLAGPLSVKKFSRDAEYEADLLGIEYAYAAGYDPQALLDALEKLHAIEVQRNEELAKIPGYHLAGKIPFHSVIAKGFANYPLTEERIGRLQGEIATFLPDRKDYVIDTNEFQEIKARLLASQAPVLHHHVGGSDDDRNGPVLRRAPEVEVETIPDLQKVQSLAFVK
jgi:predicted Zn-dependent protease